MAYSYRAPLIPRAFIWRRVHSLTGLWLVFFLIEHLFINSQAALLTGNENSGFVAAVNAIKNLPYLPVIEMALLGVPFLIHGLWGIHTLFTADYNSFSTDGSAPALPQYKENQGFTWQRITAWILLFGILAHVIQMRFIEYPTSVQFNGQAFYVNRITHDPGIDALAHRLHVDLYDEASVRQITRLAAGEGETEINGEPHHLNKIALSGENMKGWIAALEKWPLGENERIAVSPSFGVAELLLVRDTFKSPLMVFLYTALVLATCFHAFNGLWTFMITWGVTLTARSQTLMRMLATSLMVLVAFLGLAAIWGSYWLGGT